jgi:hypothetical protein
VWKLNWDVISQIASSLGVVITTASVVIAAASLLIGVRRYQINQQNEYISTLRKAMFSSRSAVHRLFTTVVDAAFIYETVAGVADSKTMLAAIEETYVRFFAPLTHNDADVDVQNAKKDELANELANFFSAGREFPLTSLIPVQTPLFKTCKDLTVRVGTEMEPYRFDYPSLSRVFISVNSYLDSFVDSYRDYVRGDEHWSNATLQVYQDYGPTISSAQELQTRITEQIVIEWAQQRIGSPEDPKPDYTILEHLSEIVQIVTRTYLSKSDVALMGVASQEKKEYFVPLEETTTVEQDLNEAYKGLKWILSDLDKQTYHDLVREIEAAKARRAEI